MNEGRVRGGRHSLTSTDLEFMVMGWESKRDGRKGWREGGRDEGSPCAGRQAFMMEGCHKLEGG
jgi:hypothetical protein